MGDTIFAGFPPVWSLAVSATIWVLAANAIIAFIIACYWQGKVIFVVFAGGTGDEQPNRFARFWNGEFLPDLRQRWAKAVSYVFISLAMLFTVAGLAELFMPNLPAP